MGAHVSVPMYHLTLPQRLVLEAARCRECSELQFPPRGACERCRSRSFDPVELSGRGTVHACTTISAMGAPPEFAEAARRLDEYHVAIVELVEGPRITAQLVDVAEPRIGMDVRAVTRVLYDEEGVRRYGFKFAPEMG